MEEYKNTEDTLELNIILAKYLGYKQVRPYLYQLNIKGLKTGLPSICFVGDNSNSFKFDSDWNWSIEVYKKLVVNNTFEVMFFKHVEPALLSGNKQEFFLALVEVVKYINSKSQ